jgi:hypothetical protein
MSFDENTKTGQDRESDSARHFPELKFAERMPQPRRLEMPSMSDQQAFLRLNVPDGLETNGTWPKKYITEDISAPGGIRKVRDYQFANRIALSIGR